MSTSESGVKASQIVSRASPRGLSRVSTYNFEVSEAQCRAFRASLSGSRVNKGGQGAYVGWLAG